MSPTTTASPPTSRDDPRQPDRLLPARGLEGVVGPVHEPADRRGRILLARVDDIGRAEPARQVELLLRDVDRGDAGGAGQPGSLDGVEADPAAPEDRDARPRPDPRGVTDRAHTGEHRAADERGPVQWHAGVDRHRTGLGDHGVLREGGHRQEVVQRLPVAGKPA
jgi:hypothetical protein